MIFVIRMTKTEILMSRLSQNWITEKHIDFEYKKYVLLAYLQEVSQDFDRSFLYPTLAELVDHYRLVVHLKENKNDLFNQFPDRMLSANMESFTVHFEKTLKDDALMAEVESILDFSIPQFEKHLMEGKRIFEFIESHLSIQPVGLVPLNREEGFFIFRNGDSRETSVFEYQLTIFESPNEKYRGIYCQQLATYERNLVNTNESIKGDLMRHNKRPNPATWVIESDLKFPFEETLVPVAKRSFVKYLSQQFQA